MAGRKGSPRIAQHQMRISAHGGVDGELICSLKALYSCRARGRALLKTYLELRLTLPYL